AAKLEDVLRWLQWPGYSAKTAKLINDRGPSTCRWFLEGEVFVNFKRARMGSILLHGQAGCGKSTIMAAAMQDLELHCASEEWNALVAIHLFDRTDHLQRNITSLLISILAQLVLRHREHAILHLTNPRARTAGSAATRDQMEHAIHAILADTRSCVFILVDGLDEADDEKIVPFLRHLRTHPTVSLLVSSRTIVAIGDLCQSLVSVDDTRANTDVATLVRASLQTGDLKSLSGNVHEKKVYDRLVEGATGNLRWAALLIEDLRKLIGIPVQLSRRLESLPRSLMQLCKQRLDSIEKDIQTDFRRVLLWLACSREPLSRTDFARLLAFDHSGSSPVYDDTLVPHPDAAINMIDTMFVTVADSIVRIAHASVQEYLLEQEFQDSSNSHALLARMSIAYVAGAHPVDPCSHLAVGWVSFIGTAGISCYDELERDITAILHQIRGRPDVDVVLGKALRLASKLGHARL
ncbi:hypothetical protein GGG16DRAFT_34265, partial [Schizophyllum commune]